MRALIVYESMYGNTHAIAAQIANGMRATLGEVEMVAAHEVTREQVAAADVLVVGGPTHAHGMTSAATRRSARDAAHKPDSPLVVENEIDGPGLRDWFDGVGQIAGTRAAAFDTRIDASVLVTGHASKGISHRLRRHGCLLIADPESVLVTKTSELVAGEPERAKHWGHALALAVTPAHELRDSGDVKK